MSKHEPDYEEINRLEHELFPEWFAENDKPKQSVKPAKRKRQYEEEKLYGSAYYPASASTGVLPHGLSVGMTLRPAKRQVVLPWEPPHS